MQITPANSFQRLGPRARLGVVGGAVLLCAALATSVVRMDRAACGPKGPPPVPVTAERPVRQDVPVYLQGLGTVQAFNTVTLKVRVDGTLEEVRFTEGQNVKAGDVLAQIDPRPYRAALNQAQAKKAQDESQLPSARRDVERLESLSKSNFATAQTIERQRAVVAQLEAAVKARLNIIIMGGTGAGKTTLLNALSAFINGKERIVTIEDAAELQLKQPHVARLETRPPNLEGNGAVRQRELLVNSLRMRPDRIVVGEVRGEEALDMLQAMNTGHDGSLTTIHANSPRDGVSRLEVMVSLANSNMQLVSIRQQIASAVNLFVQASRLSDGSRRVMSVTEVTGMEGEVITLQDLFVFEKRGLSPEGKVLGRFAATGIRPKFYEKLLAAGIRLRPDLFDEVVEV